MCSFSPLEPLLCRNFFVKIYIKIAGKYQNQVQIHYFPTKLFSIVFTFFFVVISFARFCPLDLKLSVGGGGKGVPGTTIGPIYGAKTGVFWDLG